MRKLTFRQLAMKIYKKWGYSPVSNNSASFLSRKVELTQDQVENVIKAMDIYGPHHTDDPLVNWVVDCLQLEEYFGYNSELYENEIEAFASIE